VPTTDSSAIFMGREPRRVRTRFAPSPTGFLHVGAFRTALFSYLLAKKYDGDFLLRIEDTDQKRLVKGSLEHIIQSLHALGTPYDEGPDQAAISALPEAYGTIDSGLVPENGGAHGPYIQSQRRARYTEIVEQLLDEGKAYWAFETEEELAAKKAACDARKIPNRYDRHFRDYPLAEARKRVADGERAVVRLKMPTEGPIRTVDFLRGETLWDATTQDDFVILKADGLPVYHLAAMVDDHDMEISHILRGEEWISSTPKHVSVFQALGWEAPIFVHTPNVLGKDGKKLSKRNGALPLIGPVPELKDGVLTNEMLRGYLNQDGILPEALFNFLAICGWSPGDDRELMGREEIIEAFNISKISLSPGIFDLDKLKWMNGVYIRNLTPCAFYERARPFLPADLDPDYAAAAIALEQERVKELSEVPTVTDFFFMELPEYQEKSVEKWLKGSGAYLAELDSTLASLSEWSVAAIETVVRSVATSHKREKGEVTHPVRVALTGREVGPGLFELMHVLGKERLALRFKKAKEFADGGTDS
jgi:glutamyl-tRNA synthetase